MYVVAWVKDGKMVNRFTTDPQSVLSCITQDDIDLVDETGFVCGLDDDNTDWSVIKEGEWDFSE